MTISPKDLRIDNLLYQKNTALVAKVSSINQSGFTCRDEFGIAIKEGLFEPIPITHIWLLRLGFEIVKGSVNDYLIEFQFENEHHCSAFLWVSTSNEDGQNKHNIYPLVSITVDREHEVYTGIEYVHELQNLYYSLTKKELI